jgi:hypothetical protein
MEIVGGKEAVSSVKGLMLFVREEILPVVGEVHANMLCIG